MCKPPENSIEEQITCYRKTIEITVKTKLRTYWNSICDLHTAEEDIIGSVYEKIIKILYKFPERKLNSSYLQKVVNSCVVNYYQIERKHFSKRAVFENDFSKYRNKNDAGPASQEYGREDFNLEEISEHSAFLWYIRILYVEIDKLSEQDRMIFILSRYHGKSIKELSESTGLTINNIKVKLFRIRLKLAKAVLGDSYRPMKKSWKHICI
ncbi:MAG: sigma-70 family RNA polymerase sigma factor [Ruminiclostridium sp.]|nr:sigma-70 family RNA polymerase sigma factor [Ruminiclostridium sp.]